MSMEIYPISFKARIILGMDKPKKCGVLSLINSKSESQLCPEVKTSFATFLKNFIKSKLTIQIKKPS